MTVKNLKYDAPLVRVENGGFERAMRDFIKITRNNGVFRKLRERAETPKRGERKRKKRLRAADRRKKLEEKSKIFRAQSGHSGK